ncbi:hypothetical protein KUTeg_018477 [Tegillarca granosa]|uniref:START domain-containing protein n=1 Tax=Tegillarca granosa TaxID=220873 RepID=A0ABQ9EHW0_TEGGR|nr:hypothetical protein KUTeg_018477 [Tegillarca granosa]
MDYRAKGEQVAQTLQNYCNSEDSWKPVKEGKNFKILYRKSSEFDGYIVVFDYVEPLPDGQRLKWDKTMKSIEILKQIDSDLRINRACTHSAAMGLISPRDFVDLIQIKETDEYISTNAVSVDNEKPEDNSHVRGWNYHTAVSIECDEFPPEKKFVRGWNYCCGIVVFKISNDPNKCKLVSLIQPDIKGMLPKSLVDSTIPSSMTDFFTQLTKALKDDGELNE